MGLWAAACAGSGRRNADSGVDSDAKVAAASAAGDERADARVADAAALPVPGQWPGGEYSSYGCEAMGLSALVVGRASARLTASSMELTPGEVLRRGNAGSGVSVLTATAGGALASDRDGFWLLPRDGQARFVEAKGDGWVLGFLVADLDGDHDDDVVVQNDVDVPLASGASVFGTRLATWERVAEGYVRRGAIDIPGSPPPTPALGDVDEDGRIDLVVPEIGAPLVYRNDGALGFERGARGTQLALERINSEPGGLALYDANGDGHLDAVATYSSYSAGRDEIFIAVYAGDGKGGFGAPAVNVVRAGWESPVRAGGYGDITTDGVVDVVLTLQEASGYNVYVAAGQPGGGFAALQPAFALAHASEAVPHDPDGDGLFDLYAFQTVPDIGVVLTVLRPRGGMTFSVHEHVVPVGGGHALVPRADGTIELLLRDDCGRPCDARCAGRCVLEQCVACIDDRDCTGASCRQGECVRVSGDAGAEDAGR